MAAPHHRRDEPVLELTPEEKLRLLQAKIAGQRLDIAEAYTDCRPAMKYADYAMQAVHFVKRNPIAVTVGMAVLTRFSWSPLRKLVAWPARIYAGYKLISNFVPGLAAPPPARRRRW